MQTFLPYPDFAASARVLDVRRLGKQRVEAMTILCCHANLALGTGGLGWQRHPATNMWRGYGQCLASYGIAICEEWIGRGYNDNLLKFFCDCLEFCPDWDDSMNPPWLGDPAFHASHRAALLYKDPIHYAQFGWTEAPSLAYVWPVQKRN